MQKINISEIDLSSIQLDGVDRRDYPDMVDAYASYAEWQNGQPLDENQLEALTEQYCDVIQEKAIEEVSGA